MKLSWEFASRRRLPLSTSAMASGNRGEVGSTPDEFPPTVLAREGQSPLFLTCEHASCLVPPELADLGLPGDEFRTHIGWDIGAAAVTEELSRRLKAAAVLSSVSRLVVDCNRDLNAADLMPAKSHGVEVPGNRDLDRRAVDERLRRYYEPFHRVIDESLASRDASLLLSIHSFTAEYDGREFDIGVLFDDYEREAEQLAQRLREQGFHVRMNEPYSGREGLIHSAQLHGRRAGIVYLELELNNALIANADDARSIAARIAPALVAFAGLR